MKDLENRKQKHIRLVLERNTQTDITTGLEDVNLIHRCLPEMDLDEVETDITLFGKRLSAPLIISAMTGGTDQAKSINSVLAEAAEEFKIGMGVGSQRIAIENPSTEHTFKIVREKAPSTLIFGNLGCPQISKWGVKEARKAVDMINADVLAIHMNALQEVVQIDGDAQFKNVLRKVSELTRELDVPILMKETGAGIAFEEAVKIEEAGVKGVEVAGVGGTSWAAVEYHAAKQLGRRDREALGSALWNWGIPTTVSIVECSSSTKLKVIASGGIRSGVDMAKAIALGAEAVGVAQPFLRKAVEGYEPLRTEIERMLSEFRTVMFLLGVRNIWELKKVPLVITGKTSDWLALRGFNPKVYSLR
ncbi:MAG: type 2 isopentenyl-diphosphate Delta-isomerase [Candidatus Bathyarchaeia archaeon]